MKQVKYDESAEEAINDIIKQRSKTKELPITKQAIVHNAIMQLRKKECKQ